MNNNQKMLLGVAVVGVAAYYYWKSQQPKPAAKFVGQDGTIFKGRPNQPLFKAANGKYGNFDWQQSCNCHTGTYKTPAGDTGYTCKNGNSSPNSKGPCEKGKAQL